MICTCGARMSCTDTRPKGPHETRRRYACQACGQRLTTIEQIVDSKRSAVVTPADLAKWKSDVLAQITRTLNQPIAKND